MPYRIVVEPQEFEQYAAVIDPEKILQLPFSNLGQGSIPARNWIWEHSKAEGHERHWIIDDNIMWFARLNKNKKLRLTTGVGFKVVEDLTLRYENVPLSGMQYEMFTPALQKVTPLIFNTRVYSCLLIQNNLTVRWRGRYNEDTDLSLRVLKMGFCTILCQVFIIKKITTLKMKGGNTEELYRDGGRLKMAQSLENQHPDVVKIRRRWGRYQHVVNYRPFKKNKLILKPGIVVPSEPNEYGMKLVRLDKSE